MKAFMHEIGEGFRLCQIYVAVDLIDLTDTSHSTGHNFNSGHTHDAYTPVIDTCGTSCPSTTGDKWSTLMCE
eukprot:scaffold6291_cov151-Alexandrium_tamarense.AAC.1